MYCYVFTWFDPYLQEKIFGAICPRCNHYHWNLLNDDNGDCALPVLQCHNCDFFGVPAENAFDYRDGLTKVNPEYKCSNIHFQVVKRRQKPNTFQRSYNTRSNSKNVNPPPSRVYFCNNPNARSNNNYAKQLIQHFSRFNWYKVPLRFIEYIRYDECAENLLGTRPLNRYELVRLYESRFDSEVCKEFHVENVGWHHLNAECPSYYYTGIPVFSYDINIDQYPELKPIVDELSGNRGFVAQCKEKDGSISYAYYTCD